MNIWNHNFERTGTVYVLRAQNIMTHSSTARMECTTSFILGVYATEEAAVLQLAQLKQNDTWLKYNQWCTAETWFRVEQHNILDMISDGEADDRPQ